MTTFTDLAGITLTSAEEALLQAAPPYEDGQGELSSINNDVASLVLKLTYLSGTIGAGANKTKIDAAITALA